MQPPQHRPSVALLGRGLHTGAACAVTLERREGPVCFVAGNATVERRTLCVARSDFGVRLRCAATGFEVELVEHLFGALGGLGVQRGVAITVEGPEVPLLDGGARRFCEALRRLGPPPERPSLRVLRSESYELDDSLYCFEPAPECSVTVQVDFEGIGSGSANWDGTADCFEESIAPARTFGFLRQAAALRSAGRGRYVDPSAVVVMADDGSVAPGYPPLIGGADELARHKLLDLLGDLYLYGGPPLGRIWARRPGHTKNHMAARRALRSGVLSPHGSDFHHGAVIC